VTTATRVREPAVAGTFYPARPSSLARTVDELLAERAPVSIDAKAFIVPHAGYVYSGPVAASAYRVLTARRDDVRRVVLVGPAHRAFLPGVAVPSVAAFRTPLGDVAIDAAARERVADLDGVVVDDAPHVAEHSIEVHLPFLQRALEDITIVPLVVGRAATTDVVRVLDALWNGPGTALIVSSDLSHYEDHDSATRHDLVTIDAITRGAGDSVGPYDACGAYAVRGLIEVGRDRGLEPTVLDRRTSGDTAGPRDRVVGYAAIAYAEPDAAAR
jgi:AmmeMemoRadiSam system protein B